MGGPGGVAGEFLLGFKDGVDAFRGDDGLALELEEEGRVLAVEDDDVDLVAELVVAIDDVAGGGLVAAGQVSGEEVEPDLLTGGAEGAGVDEGAADGGEAVLDVAVDFREHVGEGPFHSGDRIGRRGGWMQCRMTLNERAWGAMGGAEPNG